MDAFIRFYIYTVIFIAGLCVGSYLNVLIYRIPRGINTVKGHSFCPGCGHKLSWYDLFPVFSYVFLGGRCRYCKAPISPRYAVVELLNALLWLAYAQIFIMYPVTMIGHFIFGSALLCVIFIDAEHMLIFDRFNLAVALGGILTAADQYINIYILQNVYPSTLTIADRLIGAVCVSGVFFLIALISRGRAMGGGDIKLTAAAGIALGWQNMLVMLVVASVAGTIGSLIQLAMQKHRAKRTLKGINEVAVSDTSEQETTQAGAASSETHVQGGETDHAGISDGTSEDGVEAALGHVVPFGPYLAGSMIAMSFIGTELVNFYLKLCGY